MFTKLGSLLGALAFFVMVAVGSHQKIEVDYMNAHQPPSLQQLMANTVRVSAPGGEVCTGWFLKGTNKVITAAHCYGFDPAFLGKDAPVSNIYFADETKVPYHVVKIQTDANDDMHDWAVLEPVGASNVAVPVGLPVCVDKPPYGAPITIVGAGLDYWPEFNFGYISNPDFNHNGSIATGPDHAVILDAKVLPGNSGGPVIEQDTGCVIATAEEIDVHGAGGMQGAQIGAPVYGDNLINWIKS